jgi:hypothetical protein
MRRRSVTGSKSMPSSAPGSAVNGLVVSVGSAASVLFAEAAPDIGSIVKRRAWSVSA